MRIPSLILALFSALAAAPNDIQLPEAGLDPEKGLSLSLAHRSTGFGLHEEGFELSLRPRLPVVSQIFFAYRFQHFTSDTTQEKNLTASGHGFELGSEITYANFFRTRIHGSLDLDAGGSVVSPLFHAFLREELRFQKAFVYLQVDTDKDLKTNGALFVPTLGGGLALSPFWKVSANFQYLPDSSPASFEAGDLSLRLRSVWQPASLIALSVECGWTIGQFPELLGGLRFTPPASLPLPDVEILSGVNTLRTLEVSVKAGYRFRFASEKPVAAKTNAAETPTNRIPSLAFAPLYNATDKQEYEGLCDLFPDLLFQEISRRSMRGNNAPKVLHGGAIQDLLYFYRKKEQADVGKELLAILKDRFELDWLVTAKLYNTSKGYALRIYLNSLKDQAIQIIEKMVSPSDRSDFQKVVSASASEILRNIQK